MVDRLLRAMSPAALITSVLALVVAGAGIGYTAGQIGTNDLENNAVTSAKVKNGTLKDADMVKEDRLHLIGVNGVDFSDGGEGDCFWGSPLDPSVIQGAGYRIDRSGIVHLSGIIIGGNGPGGDATCGDEDEDHVALVLPKKYVPKVTQFFPVGGGAFPVYVIGKGGLEGFPAGAVYVQDGSTFLDGLSFPAASSAISPPPAPPIMPRHGGRVLGQHLTLPH